MAGRVDGAVQDSAESLEAQGAGDSGVNDGIGICGGELFHFQSICSVENNNDLLEGDSCFLEKSFLVDAELQIFFPIFTLICCEIFPFTSIASDDNDSGVGEFLHVVKRCIAREIGESRLILIKRSTESCQDFFGGIFFGLLLLRVTGGRLDGGV